jgi:hypothetical protein
MQEELLTTGQIARDLAIQMRDGIVGSLSDAIFRAEDLGDALSQVGMRMLEYWMQEAMLKPLVTQGMSFGTQLLGNLLGGVSQASVKVRPGGEMGSLTAAMHHTGGVGRYDTFGMRLVSASLFANAARLHSGVGPGERAAIITDEKGVFTPGQMRAIGRGWSGGRDKAGLSELAGLLGQILSAVRERQKISTTIVDQRDLLTRGDMEGRKGEELVMTHLARNGR